MNIDDWVWIIRPGDRFYGRKFSICALAYAFDFRSGGPGRVTGYTVTGRDGVWRDYAAVDLQYTTPRRRKFTTQMMLF